MGTRLFPRGHVSSNVLPWHRAGDVTFAQVMRGEGSTMIGLVDYARREDMETALRKLDDTEVKKCE